MQCEAWRLSIDEPSDLLQGVICQLPDPLVLVAFCDAGPASFSGLVSCNLCPCFSCVLVFLRQFFYALLLSAHLFKDFLEYFSESLSTMQVAEATFELLRGLRGRSGRR